MIENPMFCPGDKAVCISGEPHNTKYPTGLVEGKVYTIQHIIRCKCGLVCVSVGISVKGGTICSVCNKWVASDDIHWYKQTRFVPLDTDRAIESAIFEALKGQPITNH